MNHIDEIISKYCSNGVEYKSLGELGVFYGGLSGKSKDDFNNGNSKYITYSNIYSNYEIDMNIEDLVKVNENEKQNFICKGDILFTGSSETREESGISSVVVSNPTEKIYLNSFCFGFRFNDPERLLPEYCKYLFRSSKLRKQIIKTASGVTRFNVSKKKMENVIIPLPPINVQKEIVSNLNEYKSKYEKLLKSLDKEIEIRKTVKEESIKTIINDIKYNEEKKLRDVADFRNGKGHEKSIVADGKYVVINSKFISTNGRVKKYSNEQISPLFVADILMVMSDLPNGKALARCFIVDEDDKYTLNQRIGAFHVKNDSELLSEYLCLFLNRNKQLLKYDNKIDQTNLRKDDILNIKVKIPTIIEQKNIVEKIDKINRISEKIIDDLEKEKELRINQYNAILNKHFNYKEVCVNE